MISCGDNAGPEKIFPFDLIPRIVPRPLRRGVRGGFQPWRFMGSGFGVGGASGGQADGLAGLSAHRGERASFRPWRFMPAHLNTFRVAGV